MYNSCDYFWSDRMFVHMRKILFEAYVLIILLAVCFGASC